jgi:xanthine dehydrogenase accessory factor
MNELQAIVAMANQTEPGTALAMATVVKVQGSTYRRPGARMLLTASGDSAGIISGGCLEADVRERAQRVMTDGKACLATYDSTAPDDVVFGLGLGCNGIVQVLIEPLKSGENDNLVAFLAECQAQRRAGRMITLLRCTQEPAVSAGTRLLRWPDGRITGHAMPPAIEAALRQALLIAPVKSATLQQIELADGATLEALVEEIAPPVPLVIFGGGDDAIPLARCADLLGWHITVIDARPAYANRERFPAADAVHCLRPEDLAECAQELLPPDALVVVMTHNYLQDLDLLRILLARRLRYLGALGPRARTQRLLDELHRDNGAIRPETLAALHSPAGLDLGAETPAEIALSLVAEMQATLACRPGGSLRNRQGGIHAPHDTPDNEKTQP